MVTQGTKRLEDITQLHAMTGIEDALCYLLTEQEDTYELLHAIADYRIEEIKLIARYYKPDKSGYIVPLIEEFIEIGFDALNPLQ